MVIIDTSNQHMVARECAVESANWLSWIASWIHFSFSNYIVGFCARSKASSFTSILSTCICLSLALFPFLSQIDWSFRQHEMTQLNANFGSAFLLRISVTFIQQWTKARTKRRRNTFTLNANRKLFTFRNLYGIHEIDLDVKQGIIKYHTNRTNLHIKKNIAEHTHMRARSKNTSRNWTKKQPENR